jgi:uroporphyrinogen decarboxylase
MKDSMSSMERVLCTLGHQEPDRVPLFLLLSLYGAREAGLSVKEYFSSSENVVRTQLYMKEKYGNDCLYTFSYAALEVEAWGGEVFFPAEGPPNSGEPFLKIGQIESLTIPSIEEVPGLQRVIEVTRRLAVETRGDTPIIGVVMSPFSLPVMQMGFEEYLNLLYFDKSRFRHLMSINQQFCLSWANAQLNAGATAICYFNPLASTDIIDKPLYLATGYPVDIQTTAGIQGPVATHLASGRVLPVLEEVIGTGSAVLGIGNDEDPGVIRKSAQSRITLMGNLNGVEMCGWSEETAIGKVRELIHKAAAGGGFILSDSHGEIPWQVPENVLLSISEAVREWGRYPSAGTRR